MTNLFNFPNITAGPDQFLVGVATQVPIFPIMFLFFVYIVIVTGGSMGQLRRSGYLDFPLWSTLALLVCDLLALLFSTTSGIIGPIVLVVCLGLTIFSGLWLFLTRGRFEP